MMPPIHDDEPELVPPAEMLRLRAALVRPPEARTRARHLAALSAAAGERVSSGGAGRFARRGVRAAAAVVAGLAITSGLAGAQLLPQPAQRLLSEVSDRFTSPDQAPPATAGDVGGTTDGPSTSPPERDRVADAPAASGTSDDADPTPDGEVGVTTTDTTSTSEPKGTTSTTVPPTTSTTIPGPTGPGSPDDPTDPGATDGGSTDPTDGGSTGPGGTGGGTTDPGSGGGGEATDGGSSGGGLGTTEVPPPPTEDPVPPAGGSG